MRNRVVWAVGVLIVLAVGIGVVVATRDDNGNAAAPETPATTTSTTVFDDTTSSSTTAAPTTSTRVTRPTTTTAVKASTTTAPGTSTTAGSGGRCGSGKASVSFTAKDLVTDALSSTFVPEVTVDNQVSTAIEVEEITIEVTYPSSEVRTVRFNTAGTAIAPGTSASFTSDKLTSAQRYQAVRFTRFTYFTEGNKTDCRVTTP